MERESINIYMYPLENYREPADAVGSPAHVGSLRNAIDFDCPEGTEIIAPLDGEVMYVKQNSNEGGVLDMKYYNSGNRIILQHANKEYTAFEHLRYQGACVSVGQKVIPGQLIGYTGNTGYSSCPHLHFEVFIDPKNDEFEGETVKVRFTNGASLEVI